MPHSRKRRPAPSHPCVLCSFDEMPPPNQNGVSQCPRCCNRSLYLSPKVASSDAARQRALEQGAQTLAGYLPPAAPNSPARRLLIAETEDGWLGLLLVDPAQTYTSPQAAQILGRSPDWIDFVAELGLLPDARNAGAGWLIPASVIADTLFGQVPPSGTPKAVASKMGTNAASLLAELLRAEAVFNSGTTPLDGLHGATPLDGLIIAMARLNYLVDAELVPEAEAKESVAEIPFFEAAPRLYLIDLGPEDDPDSLGLGAVLGCFYPDGCNINFDDPDDIRDAMEEVISAIGDSDHDYECWLLTDNQAELIALHSEEDEGEEEGNEASSADEWTVSNLQRMFANPVYAGVGQYPATVDESTWLKAATLQIGDVGARTYLYTLRDELAKALRASGQMLPNWMRDQDWPAAAAAECEPEPESYLRRLLKQLRHELGGTPK